MIVRVKLLPFDDLPEGAASNAVRDLNMSALLLAARLRAKHRHLHCEHHPAHKHITVIVAEATGGIRLDKSGLCCEELAARVVPA